MLKKIEVEVSEIIVFITECKMDKVVLKLVDGTAYTAYMIENTGIDYVRVKYKVEPRVIYLPRDF